MGLRASMSRPEELYEYSKIIDENRDKYDGMPCQSAFDVLAGVGENPEERPEGQEALWQKIENDREISEETMEWLNDITEQYPMKTFSELDMRRHEQRVIAHLLDDVQMWRGDGQFVTELVQTALSDDEMLSRNQEEWLRACCYKYRDQIRQNVTVKGIIDSELAGYVDEPFSFLEQIMNECKPKHQKLIKNTNYDAN